MWRRRVKWMYRRLYQPGDTGEAEVRGQKERYDTTINTEPGGMKSSVEIWKGREKR